MFLNIVNEFAKLDSYLSKHLEDTSVLNIHQQQFRMNCLIVQLCNLYGALRADINNAMFVLVQANETMDISNKTQSLFFILCKV